MLKKTITYTNFNDGSELTEDFFFNLNKAEVMEMEMSTSGGLAERIKRIVAAQDSTEIIKIFKELILKAYGEKSGDGKRFMKKDKDGNPLSNKFEETEAFSILFMELATDEKKASEFINGIIPTDINKEVAKTVKHPAAK